MRYDIPAIPTFYEGRRYRSRLEARWAAFFDVLRIHHEYEPFDLGAWSPDFLLAGGVLAEVKPIAAELDQIGVSADERATKLKMLGAATSADVVGPLLLVGTAPVPVRFWDDACILVGSASFLHPPVVTTVCGCLFDDEDADDPARSWQPAVLGSFSTDRGRISDVIVNSDSEWEAVCSGYAWNSANDLQFEPNRFLLAWAEATNRVQWRPA